MAEAALSAPPAITGVPGGIHVMSNNFLLVRPRVLVDSMIVGKVVWSIPRKSKIGSDQAQLLISINSDPDASEGSVINSPVSLNPIKSFAINMVEIFLKFPGSFFLIQRILGAVKPSKTGLPKEFLIYDLPSY